MRGNPQITAVILSVGALVSVPGPAAAHGIEGANSGGIRLTWTVTGVTVAGLCAGVAAASGRVRIRERAFTVSDWIVRLVLVSLGSVTLLSVFEHSAVVGASGAVTGGVAGALVARGDRRVRAEAVTGALGLHRLIEGIALVGLWNSGSAIGAAGAVVVAGHTIVECVAIGGHAGLAWPSAVRSVAAVAAAFVSGVLLGVYGLGTVVPGVPLSAVTGGLLLSLGVTETGIGRWLQ